jgi:hypothetical protein
MAYERMPAQEGDVTIPFASIRSLSEGYLTLALAPLIRYSRYFAGLLDDVRAPRIVHEEQPFPIRLAPQDTG